MLREDRRRRMAAHDEWVVSIVDDEASVRGSVGHLLGPHPGGDSPAPEAVMATPRARAEVSGRTARVETAGLECVGASGGLPWSRLRRVTAFISAHLDEALSLAQLGAV